MRCVRAVITEQQPVGSIRNLVLEASLLQPRPLICGDLGPVTLFRCLAASLVYWDVLGIYLEVSKDEIIHGKAPGAVPNLVSRNHSCYCHYLCHPDFQRALRNELFNFFIYSLHILPPLSTLLCRPLTPHPLPRPRHIRWLKY